MVLINPDLLASGNIRYYYPRNQLMSHTKQVASGMQQTALQIHLIIRGN